MSTRRARYASDKQVARAFRLAAAAGMSKPTRFRLGADGSIELDSAPAPVISGAWKESPDAALAAWEAEHGAARRQ